MLKTILIIVVVVLGGLAVFAAKRPDTFQIKRSKNIQADPEDIFPYLNDLHAFRSWSPWEEKDPAMKRIHSGADSGVGAAYEWDGDKTVGKGRMEIVESVPHSKVGIKLDFIKPFEAHNRVDFELSSRNDITEVSWIMSGSNSFMSKLMSLFVSMDKMVGPDFESGLAKLKELVEADGQA